MSDIDKYLAIKLDDESRETVRKLALYDEIRADHVTLAYPHNGETFSAEWIPGERELGDKIEIHTKGFSVTDDIQVLVVAIDGTTTRPFDKGTLHITVSKRQGIPSTLANEAILNVTLVPFSRQLSGTIVWLDRNKKTAPDKQQ